jgi:hypothetical protein
MKARTFKEFIDDASTKKRSAEVKFDLLIYGVQDNNKLFSRYSHSFKEEHYAYDNGNWGVDKNRLVPTEIILPGGIVSKLHIRPTSSLRLVDDNGILLICNGSNELSEFQFLPRPQFWDYKTTDGTPAKRLAQMYGLNCLNFNIFSGCEFHTQKLGCKFCSVQSTVWRDDPVKIKKKPLELADVCHLASTHDTLDYIIITGGSYLDSDKEFDAHIAVIKAVKDVLPWNGRIKGNVSMMPPKSEEKLIELYDNGVDNPSFNIEVWPEVAFGKMCPGKNKYIGFNNIIRSLKTLVKYYGEGFVWSNFVAGITPLEDLKEGFAFMAENGIIPGANIYHAEVDSAIGASIGRVKKEYIKELYLFAVDLYQKYNYKPFFNTSVLRNSLANEFYEGLL